MKNPWTGDDPDRGLVELDGTLEAVLERVTEGRLAKLEMIKAAWPHVVGVPWKDRSRPVRLENGVLTVEVVDGSTASGLRFEQARIRRELEGHIGSAEIAQIRFRIGRHGLRKASS
jgi:hypothetical protein